MNEDILENNMDTSADAEDKQSESVPVSADAEHEQSDESVPASGNAKTPVNANVNVQYWWLVANPDSPNNGGWSFREFLHSREVSFSLMHRIRSNFNDAKVGDCVICYEAGSKHQQIVAVSHVCGKDNENIFFEEDESLSVPIKYDALKNRPELNNMQFKGQPGTLFKLTPDEYQVIDQIIRKENPKPYKKTDFLADVYMENDGYERLIDLLKHKKNVILQGPPGVGKTYAAKRLAWSMMGEKADERIKFVQFHQNYAYEDFMMGYKPDGNGFKLQEGIFYRFCQEAKEKKDISHFFIIDEINRGNMSKIFGEALMLIEEDHRKEEIELPYTDDNGKGICFSVPDNLYIIGMMNTADRSLAFIDYALRRRFSFFDMKPAFGNSASDNPTGFEKYQNGLNNAKMNALVSMVSELNKEITQDKTLGEGFCIGHSYFCSIDKDMGSTEIENRLREIVDYDILPLLKEYWFDKSDNYFDKWEEKLEGVVK